MTKVGWDDGGQRMQQPTIDGRAVKASAKGGGGQQRNESIVAHTMAGYDGMGSRQGSRWRTTKWTETQQPTINGREAKTSSGW